VEKLIPEIIMDDAQRKPLVAGQLEDIGKSRNVHPLRVLATFKSLAEIN